ncbi:helix-turn-helix transcriptional regulator [Frankia sp. Cr2]|uniref:helix-turn-helix domain-containing protein n=1 Tax=Frankia sp. Cr2 TaxID=3073932 RepID=UPI002AD35FCF|nr:helix-turn-helix transcriptional regulator [Frankia sp. Cr2]
MVAKRQRLAARRKAVGFSQEQLAQRLGVERSTVVRWESGETETGPQPWIRPRLARTLQVSIEHLDELLTPEPIDEPETVTAEVVAMPEVHPVRHIDSADMKNLPDPHQVELLRQGLNDALSEGTMAEASLDDWERTVVRYGRATRDRPAGVLLDDLASDLAELKRALHRHRSTSALRRLTRVAAHMSGLMCLTFCKLDDRPAFRRWARTARLAADEAGDPETHSWIFAQEAYGHYYAADLLGAIDVARHAQAIVQRTPCVGAALAAALEARAHAAMRRHEETREALGRAEDILSYLSGDALTPSAFGYNEAQLLFHAGNAYTHLRNAKAAFNAQDRALELCMPGDYTDWAMTRLDRTSCLTHDGDTSDAFTYATETLINLTEPQRRGIITLRGHEILDALPKQQQTLPAARDLRELLMLTTDRKEVEGS